jgi:hypothetical protein
MAEPVDWRFRPPRGVEDIEEYFLTNIEGNQLSEGRKNAP